MKIVVDEDAFVKNGYFLVESAVEIGTMRSQIYDLINGDLKIGLLNDNDDSLRPKNILRSKEVFDFIFSPILYDSIKSFFTANPILCSLGANCVPPGGPGMGIHKDYPYLSRSKQNLEGQLLCLQLILSIDGMSEENGATVVFPGSHRGSLAKPVKVVCKPGTLIILHGALTHGVDRNVSSDFRTNLLASFTPYWVRPFSDLVSDRTKEELNDSVVRRVLGLDFLDSISREIPKASTKKTENDVKRFV